METAMAKKISDELRNWFSIDHCGSGLLVSKSECGRLLALADRIDSEMVELPKDADGVPIHVGDTVWGCISGMQMAVHELGLTDRWAISTDTGFIPKASAVTHVRLDSFERIADELDEQAGSLTKDGYTWQEDAIHNFADRIRKLAEKDGERS